MNRDEGGGASGLNADAGAGEIEFVRDPGGEKVLIVGDEYLVGARVFAKL